MKALVTVAIGVLMVFMYACQPKDQQSTKQCLRINLKEEPSSLDPRRGRNLTGASHLHAMLFEGLMRLNSQGELECAQASSYEISPDKKTYTFHLGNTYWSDGTPVTAYDFEKAWKDILNPHFPSLDSHIMMCIKNAAAAKKGELPLNSLGIHAKDAKTLVVELEHPTPHFLHITASSTLFPINHNQDAHYPNWYQDAGPHFVSNGPFKLTQWKHHNDMTFEKNPHYRQADQVKLDTIYVTMVSNESATLHMYNAKKLDIVGLPISPLPTDSYPQLIKKNALQTFQAPGTMVCMFNTKKFPFYNANIRKAFTYAINRQLLIDNITQLKEQPALGLLPPQLKKNGKTFINDGNQEKARDYLQKGLKELGIQASDLNGKVSFSYWVHDHACPMLPQALQQQWHETLGVEVELDGLEYKTLHDKGKNELFSMGYFVFLSVYHDPIDLLDRFKYPYNTRNYARWQNEKYTELLTQSAQTTTQEEHFALLDQAEQILMDEMPIAPIFHWSYGLMIQPHVKGFAISPLGFLCFDKISLEQKSL